MNADRNQQEQLQEKNEASTQQLEQQQRQSPGSVSQQQVTNKVGAGFATREPPDSHTCASDLQRGRQQYWE